MSDGNKNNIVPPNGNRKGLDPSFSDEAKLATNIPPRNSNYQFNQMINEDEEADDDLVQDDEEKNTNDNEDQTKKQRVAEEAGKEIEEDIQKEEKRKKKRKKQRNNEEKTDSKDHKDDKKDSKSSDLAKVAGKATYKKKQKWKFIIIAAAICSVFIIFLVLILVLSSEGGGRATNQDMIHETINHTGENAMTEEEKAEYESPWWDCDEENLVDCDEKIIAQNYIEFYDRFDRLYNKYENRFDDVKLEDTKYHVLATAFFDYSPEQVNDDINTKAPLGDVDNLYGETGALVMCDDEYETTGTCVEDINDDSYTMANLFSNNKEKVEKYQTDTDTLRKLLRQFITYEGVCTLEKVGDCVEGENGCECTITGYHGFTPIKSCKKTIIQESVNETFTLMEYIGYIVAEIFTIGIYGTPGEKNCYESMNTGEWASYSYEIKEDINFCQYYEWLYETDYLDNMPHLKDSFNELQTLAATTGRDLDSLKKNLRLGYINEIITDATYGSGKDPISKDEAVGGYGVYTLSGAIYITVTSNNPNKATGSYPLDQYVEGVLAAEVGVFWGSRNSSYINASVDQVIEAWRANAVAIRSYVLSRTKNGTVPIVNSSAAQNFSNAYLNAQTNQALAMREAAMSTAGQVLTINGKILSAEYDSFCKKESNGYNCTDSVCSVMYQKKGGNTNHIISIPAAYKGRFAGGHCRGMSQWHSIYSAAQGKTYQEMLAYYYDPSAKLTKLDYETGIMSTIVGVSDSLWKDEATLSCNYGIEIPLRVAGYKEESSGDIYDSAQYTSELNSAFNNKLIEIAMSMANNKEIIGDCSDFVSAALVRTYESMGITSSINTDDYSVSLYNKTKDKSVRVEELMPGDLLFWHSRSSGRIHHVAIYLGNGKMIETNTSTTEEITGSRSIPAVVNVWDFGTEYTSSTDNWKFVGATRGFV